VSQLRASLASSTSKFFDCDRSLDAENIAPIVKSASGSDCLLSAWKGNAQVTRSSETQSKNKIESRVARDLEVPEVANENVESNNQATDDVVETVSGLQSDNLQKEVILVKKACHDVDAMKMCKEVTATEKEVAAMRVDRDQHQKSSKLLSMSKGRVNSSQPLSAR
jgi:hypothetical protein